MRSVTSGAGVALLRGNLLQRFLPQKPWTQALFIQLSSVLLIACVSPAVINSVFVFELRSLGLHLEQGLFWLCVHLAIVSLLAKAFAMPVWWRWIHVIFPLAVTLMQTLALPASVYLGGFVITIALYWSVHKTRVPFYPSFPATWRAMHHLLEQMAGDQSLRVLDIGSGLGDVSLFLAKQRPHDQLSGIEIAPLPWLISYLRATFSGAPVTFTLGDYHQLDFATQDVVFAYLSPAVMMDVWHKVCREMPAGSRFISSEFPVPGVTAEHIIYPGAHAPTLYVYCMA